MKQLSTTSFKDQVATFSTLDECFDFIKDYFHEYPVRGYGTIVKQIMQRITDNSWEVWVQRYPSAD